MQYNPNKYEYVFYIKAHNGDTISSAFIESCKRISLYQALLKLKYDRRNGYLELL